MYRQVFLFKGHNPLVTLLNMIGGYWAADCWAADCWAAGCWADPA